MNLDALVKKGCRPWAPAPGAHDLDVWHEYDVPTAETFMLESQPVIFTVLGSAERNVTAVRDDRVRRVKSIASSVERSHVIHDRRARIATIVRAHQMLLETGAWRSASKSTDGPIFLAVAGLRYASEPARPPFATFRYRHRSDRHPARRRSPYTRPATGAATRCCYPYVDAVSTRRSSRVPSRYPRCGRQLPDWFPGRVELGEPQLIAAVPPSVCAPLVCRAWRNVRRRRGIETILE
jgi:hypothetical protein